MIESKAHSPTLLLYGNQFLAKDITAGFFLALLLVLLAGCGNTDSTAISSGGGSKVALSWAHTEVDQPPPTTAELLALGKEVYSNNCAACHGDSGEGDGICAAFLAPAPRNFSRGIFRFKSTPTGSLPTDQDLFRTVSIGVQGTPMPPWRYILSEEERWAVVGYIKTFSDYFQDEAPGTPVTFSSEPSASPERVARGKELFQKHCIECHGSEGYGDGPSAKNMLDSFNRPIRPRNFHKAGEFKRGHTLRDIALTVSTGNDGTPMPSFKGNMNEEEIWDLASFIMSLAEKKLDGGGTPAAAVLGEELGEPDVVLKIMERKWKNVPDRIEVRQGQVVRIEFQPTDNGLGAGHGFSVDGYDREASLNGAMVQRPKSVTFVADKAGTCSFHCTTQCSTGPMHPQMMGTLVVLPSGE
jgi:cytochrome c oxidase cbb3-type subunit 2